MRKFAWYLHIKKVMRKNGFIFLFILSFLSLGLVSCRHEKRKADISGIDLEIKIGRFDKRFWELDTLTLESDVERLKADFPEMTDIYLRRVVRFGHPDSVETWDTYRIFRRDTSVIHLYTDALEKFCDVTPYEKELTKAFRRARYFFPENPVPQINMHVSGFNQNVIIGNDFMSLSEDNYMGSDYDIYRMAMIYTYQVANMRPEKIVSDYILAWLSDQFSYTKPHSNLLDEMIYRGKLIYVSTLLMPDTDEGVIMGYDKEQMKWVETYESDMWASLVASQDLFTHDALQKGQYINDGPFTLPFSQDSPGRGGIYIGWRIVESYMDNNKEITPLQLMELDDAKMILEQSGYRPR
jgi:hypothetical protein